MNRFARIKDKISDALYVPGPAHIETDESTEAWLQRNHLPPLSKKPLLKRIGHYFLSHRIDVAGRYAGQERVQWSDSIIVWLVIAAFISLIVVSAINSDRQTPLTPEQYQDRRESDPRW